MTDTNSRNGWLTLPFGEVIVNENGSRRPVSLQMRANIKGCYPYYGATGIVDSLNDYTHDGEYILIGEDGANLLSKSKKLAFTVNGKFWANNHAHVIKCIAGMPAKFIEYFISSLDLSPYITGSAQPKLTKGNLDRILCPLPPALEQKEIADRLDTLLTQVESTQARLARIPDIIKRFRQSVLAAAVSGKLTEDWRDQINKPEWQMTSLGDLLIDATNGLAKRHGSSGLDTTVLRLADFKDCIRVTGNERTICLTEKEINKYSLQESDILVIRVNGSIDLAGKFILYSNNDAIESFCDHLIRLRIDLNKLSAKYLTYVANEGNGRWYLQNNVSTSAGQNTINQSTIKGLKIPLPSINEQTEIVRRVEQLFAYADSIEQQAKAAKERVDKLTQAILAKAFRGELTADWRAANPDLISGDNSAAALLARIQAERAAAKPRKRVTKKTAT